jgi:hypothetical protein
MTDDEYAAEIDAEAVARARSKRRFPTMSKVRRVRVDDEGPTSYQARVDREIAEAANHSREAEGDTENVR